MRVLWSCIARGILIALRQRLRIGPSVPAILVCLALSGCACCTQKVQLPDYPDLPLPADAIVPTPPESTAAVASGRFGLSEGAATFSYPIWVPDGRRGLQPSLALVYSSQSENGMLGVGWMLKGMSAIRRCKKDIARDGHNAAIQFDQSDAFCLDGQRLTAVPTAIGDVRGEYGAPGTEYKTEIDSYAQIINGPVDDQGPISFEVRMADGRRFYYGTTVDSRVEGLRARSRPSQSRNDEVQVDFDSTVRLSWSLAEIRDRYGNNLTIQYSQDGDPRIQIGYEHLPQAIFYTGTVDGSLPARRAVRLLFEPRPDVVSTFVSGLMLQTRQRLARIELEAPDPVESATVKTYTLKYGVSPTSRRSVLQEISECDRDAICLAPTVLTYSQSARQHRFVDLDTGIGNDYYNEGSIPGYAFVDRLLTGDINGDGCDDIIYSKTDFWLNVVVKAAFRLSSCYDAIAQGLEPLPSPDPSTLYQLTPKVDEAPSSSLPSRVFSPAVDYWRNTGDCQSDYQLLGCYTQLDVIDLDLDGRVDLLSYKITEDCGFAATHSCDFSTTFDQNYATSIYLASGVAPDEWNASLPLFTAERRSFTVTTTPKGIFDDQPPNTIYYTTTYVGDINGDGYPDLVRLTPQGWSFSLSHGRTLINDPLACGTSDPCLGLSSWSPFFPGTAPVTGIQNVFMTDIFAEGTKSIILRDGAQPTWYAAFRLGHEGCPTGVDACPILPPPNLGLLAGDAYASPRHDWFLDLNGDGLPDALSVPFAGGHPFVALNTGNGFEAPVYVSNGPTIAGGNAFDYDGNGTQDFVFKSAAQTSGALMWLSVDMKGDGQQQIVQLRDIGGTLGMTIWNKLANDSYSQLWSTDDLGQRSDAIAWLPVHMGHDGKTQIVQLRDNGGRLGMTVWGPQADGTYRRIGGAFDVGMSSVAKAWRAVDMQGDGQTQIVALRDHGGRLGMVVLRPAANNLYEPGWGTGDLGESSDALDWIPVHMQRDGRTQIVQLQDRRGRLGMAVWSPTSDGRYVRTGGLANLGLSSAAKAWVPVDMQGDGQTQIVQIRDNHGRLAMVVWAPDAIGGYSPQWGSGDMGQGSGAVAWLPIHTQRSGKTQIAQLWSNRGRLAMIVWSPQAGGGYAESWASNDMGQGSGSIAWMTVETPGGYKTRIVQLWKNVDKLGLITWAPDASGGYSQAWGSSDMSGYLYVMLGPTDGREFRFEPLLDQAAYPIRAGSQLKTLDLDGNGTADFVQILDGNIHLYRQQGSKDDLLTGIDDRGAVISVNYAPLTSQSTYRPRAEPGVVGHGISLSPRTNYVLNKGAWVVSSYAIPRAGSYGSAQAPNTFTIDYENARADLLGRGWLGFERITVSDQQTGARTVTSYDNTTRLGTFYPFAHLPQKVSRVTRLAQASRTHEEVQSTTYTASPQGDGKYVVVHPQTVRNLEFEGSSASDMLPIRSLTTEMSYDAFGNISKRTRTTGDGYAEAVETEYGQNLSAWLIALKKREKLTSSVPDGAVQTRRVEFEPDPGTGAILGKTIEPRGDFQTYLHLGYELDPRGLLIGWVSQDRWGRRRAAAQGYDAEGIYVVKQANALGHVQRRAVHPAFGVTTQSKDANGVGQTRSYDTFGRLRGVRSDGGGGSQFSYPSSTYPEVDEQDATGRTISLFADPHGNVIQKSWNSFDGRTVTLVNSYNSQGLLAERRGPCYLALNCALAGVETYSYDELGRPTAVTHADGSTQATYLDRKTTFTDEVGHQSYQIEEESGRVSRSVAFADDRHEIQTNFTYAPFGKLRRAVDAMNNTTSLDYDARGRLRTIEDPDRGTRRLEWSAFGDMRLRIDANGSATHYHYDALGRIVASEGPDGNTRLCWDTAPHGIGLLGSGTSSDGIETLLHYDAVGRRQSVATRVGSESFEYGYSFDSIGRLSTVDYPQAPTIPRFSIRRKYNSNGYLEEVDDPKSGDVYWRRLDLNERGQVTREALGDGSTTTRTYDGRGFLRHIASASATGPVQDLGYDYLPNGSVKTRTHVMPASTIAESFTYDSQDRLFAWIATSSDSAIPAVQQAFVYDDLGNLRTRTVESGPGSTVGYSYGSNGGGPHALSGVGADAYFYDAAGNQTSGPDRTISYNSFGLPVRIRQRSSQYDFKYDISRSRTLEDRQGFGSTLRIGGLYERRSDGAKTSHAFYIPAEQRIVGQVVAAAGTGTAERYFFHHDLLGSVEVMTNAGGGVVDRWAYEPFGDEMDPSRPGVPVRRRADGVSLGFTGNTIDPGLGLVNMKGRIYEPRLAHFLTPDPVVQDVANAESLNPYSYVRNNPLRWIDPTGFQAEDPTSSNSGGTPVQGVCVNECEFAGEVIVGQALDAPSHTVDDNGPLSPPLISADVTSRDFLKSDFEARRAAAGQEGPLALKAFDEEHNQPIDAFREHPSLFDRLADEWVALKLTVDMTLRVHSYLFPLAPLVLPEALAYEAPEGIVAAEYEAGYLGRSLGIPGRVQSRINITNEGMAHILKRHLSGGKNASQFTISEAELRSILTSRGSVGTPVTGYLESELGPVYMREIDVGRRVGLDKMADFDPTSIITILTDEYGNLISAFPGTLK